MAEQYNIDHFEYSKYLEKTPLRRLCNDFNLCRNDITATMTLLRYIRDEFTNPDSTMDADKDDMRREVYAERLLATLRDDDLMPKGDVYDTSPDDAIDMYRIGFFRAFTPLEANLRNSEEFEEWLPEAFEFILPSRGMHQPDNCLTEGVPFEETCHISNHCPVKAILNAVQLEVGSPEPNFSSYDYEVDADKAFRTRMLLLNQLANRGLMSQYQERQLENSFEAKFAATFPISR